MYTVKTAENSNKSSHCHLRGASLFLPAKLASHAWHFNITQVIQCIKIASSSTDNLGIPVKSTIPLPKSHCTAENKKKEVKKGEKAGGHERNIKWALGSDTGEGRRGMSVGGADRGSGGEPLQWDG